MHNGIIENYVELKDSLIRSGAKFTSETDTEVAAHLFNYYLEKEQLQPLAAMQATCARIRGSYAFVVLDRNHPDRILVAKQASPLVVGIAEGEVFIASDIPAALAHTRKFLILEDGDIGEFKAKSYTLLNHGQEIQREITQVTWDPITAQKGGYKHFMLKEIHEQPRAITDTFRGRIDYQDSKVVLPELDAHKDALKKVKRIVLVACGTAWHACLLTKFFIEKLARVSCEVDYASEFRYRAPVLDSETLVIAISQSGETADTLAALELANKTCLTLAICNVLGSTLSRKAKAVIFTQAGPEISVASTKAFTTQLVAGYLLGLYLGELRGSLNQSEREGKLQELANLPTLVEQALACEETVASVANQYLRTRDFLYLGRGITFPIALEGALKMKELSYIHAEGYPAGEMKHGPIALIDENMPVVVVMPKHDTIFEKTLSNLKEVESRGGQVIGITDADDMGELTRVAKHIIKVPFAGDLLSAITLTIPLQLLSYYVAMLNGTDVDLPRNLAKSVTVE